MRIGELGRLTGATPKALRLYEELGLLPAPRRLGSYRVYRREHLEAVVLIRQAQTLGFKLQELQQLATQGPLVQAVGLGLALQAVQQKRIELEQQIAAMQARAQRLDAFTQVLQDAHQAACECPEWQQLDTRQVQK